MVHKKRGNATTIRDVFMRNIGVSSLDEVNDWFRKSYADCYRLDKDEQFMQILSCFKFAKIRIIGDYDVDGICATSILVMGLKNAGYVEVSYRIPTRKEGYGISEKIIDECVLDGIELIITCDNGITGFEAVRKAKKNGIAVMITDHHQSAVDENKNKIYPDADLIIDPNAIDNSADFKSYCGAGIAYKLMKKLNSADKIFCKKIQAIAAIATITDVMSLREENYVIVRNGLKYLTNMQFVSTGLYSLISSLNLVDHIDAKDIGFRVGPCINACERVMSGGATKIVDLLLFNGAYEAALPIAQEIIELNNIRKCQTREGYNRAIDLIMINGYQNDVPIIVYIPDINEGIIGIIASQLCEEFKVPVIVFTDDSADSSFIKGSARSCGNCNIKQELDKISNLLYKYGGHQEAAGLTVYKDKLPNIHAELKKNLSNFIPETRDTYYYDIEIQENEIQTAIEELEKYKPFGNGNKEPIFKISKFVLVPKCGEFSRLLGEENNVVKISSKYADAVGFSKVASQIGNIKESKIFDLYGTITYNYYKGEKYNQIEFDDFTELNRPLKTTDLANKLRTMALKQ